MISLFEKINFRKIQVFSLCILVIGLLFSKFAISVSQIILFVAWFLEGNFKSKFTQIKNDKNLLIFLIYFFVTLLCLSYSSNFQSGITDLKLKLPFLILPIVITTSKFTKKDIKIVLFFFVLSVFVRSIFDFIILYSNNFTTYRKLYFSLSHIRFSLMINLAFFIICKYYYDNKQNISKIKRTLLFLICLWLISFLFVLQSLTGIVILIVVSYIILLYSTFSIKKKKKKLFLSFLSIIFPILIFCYIFYEIHDFYDFEKAELKKLEKYTESGNLYKHNIDNLEIENKNYVWLYVCEKELEKEWNKRSELDYDSLDNDSNILKFTLIRYLNSKGLKKDSAGISKLSDKDISNIEQGVANYRDMQKLNISNRIKKIIWQFDIYKRTGNPSGFSVAQRIEYLKTGWNIFKRFPILGVGTGDIRNAFQEQYIIDKSKIEQEYRKTSHNQYLTDLIKFGLFGFFLTMISLLYPFFKKRKHKEFLPSVYMLIVLLSMINEDTFQTLVGVSFSVVFYSLFVLLENENPEDF